MLCAWNESRTQTQSMMNHSFLRQRNANTTHPHTFLVDASASLHNNRLIALTIIICSFIRIYNTITQWWHPLMKFTGRWLDRSKLGIGVDDDVLCTCILYCALCALRAYDLAVKMIPREFLTTIECASITHHCRFRSHCMPITIELAQSANWLKMLPKCYKSE